MKAESYGHPAIYLLEYISQYTYHIYILERIKYYGRIIKEKITKLQKQYHIAKKNLKVASAEYTTEEAILTKSEPLEALNRMIQVYCQPYIDHFAKNNNFVFLLIL